MEKQTRKYNESRAVNGGARPAHTAMAQEPEVITSAQNPRVKYLLTLQQKSQERKSAGRFVVEGRRELMHCIEAGYRVDSAFVREDLLGTPDLSLPQGASLIPVNARVYERIAYRGGTEGIVAIVESRTLRLTDLRLRPNPLIVVLESVEKPGNLGALPAAPYWHNDEGFHAIFGLAPRIAMASFLAFLVGSFVNAYVMSRMKIQSGGRNFSARAIMSTVYGEAADSIIFFPLALGGVVPLKELPILIISQVILKTLYEILVLPVTIRVVKATKRHEGEDAYDNDMNYSIWKVFSL